MGWGLVGLVVVALSAQACRLGGLKRRAARAVAGAHSLVGRRGRLRRDGPFGPPSRSVFLAAVATGFGVRLLWVIWATRTPTLLTDPAEYLRIASTISHGGTPVFGGLDHSAYWPPGYPALLAPFVRVAEETGWMSAAFTASLLNVVAGTATIALTGIIAARWVGPASRNGAAWMVALCPALVYWTSTAHTETVFTPLFLGVIVLSTWAMDSASRRRWVVVGLLVGAAFLVRSPGIIALVVPAAAIRATGRTWRGVPQATGLVVLGALVLLGPWTIRNGVQVGIWTPASTNNAAAACFGHHEETQAEWNPGELSAEMQQDCYGGSPFDDRRLLSLYTEGGLLPPGIALGDPDEARWYREAMGQAVRFAATHPVEELRLSAEKVWETWRGEGRVVDGARNYAEPGWAGRGHDALGALADLWTWIVVLLALVALAVVPACRRALPVWAPIALYTLAIVGGVAEAHYRYPVVPLVAVLAAGFLARHRIEGAP